MLGAIGCRMKVDILIILVKTTIATMIGKIGITIPREEILNATAMQTIARGRQANIMTIAVMLTVTATLVIVTIMILSMKEGIVEEEIVIEIMKTTAMIDRDQEMNTDIGMVEGEMNRRVAEVERNTDTIAVLMTTL